jgi:hydroxyethylthiazole kinase-like uncharacterized protein yjeF
MHALYSVAEIRAAEDAAYTSLPPGTLMDRAATALATRCAALLGRVYGARVALLIGAGNNGGDALFAGALLAQRGARVIALLLDPTRAHADGLLALDRAGGRVAPADPALLADADLVVDGIVGIGGRGGLRPDAAALADVSADLLTVAVDVPSGVNADTGAVTGAAVRADVTVTFGALKTGLLVGAAVEYCGEVDLVDIGLDLPAARTSVLEAVDVHALLPQPRAEDDKYTRGVVGVVAGSPQYGGAGVLATGGALAGGAGMVRYLGGAPDAVRARYPEVVVHSDVRPKDVRVQSWIVGPGMGTDDAALGLVRDVLATDVPVIVDADALTLVAQHRDLVTSRSAPTVLTPHDREFARIAEPPSADDRLGSVRRAAAELRATVLLKGNATLIADSDGTAFANPTGTPWLGTAGSGDVLSGLVGALLASGMPARLAAATGAYVHGVAGQLAAAGGPPTAVDILDAIRPAIRAIEAG